MKKEILHLDPNVHAENIAVAYGAYARELDLHFEDSEQKISR